MNGICLKRLLTLPIEFCLFSILIFGCSQAQQGSEPSSHQPFPVAPEMDSYYRKVGGEEVLGALISPRLEEGNYVYQYTVSALLYSTKSFTHEWEIGFVPIGLDLNLPSFQIRSELQDGIASGIPIYQEFIPLYEKLGAQRVGKPLSGLRYNPRQGRYEQFFEGVGMYRLEGESPGKVKLLAYGAWKCGTACLYPVPFQAEVIPPQPMDLRVLSLVKKLGTDLTGFPLSSAVKEANGKEVVIFENVVIEVPSLPDSDVKLLPLPQKLGILAEGLVPNQEDELKVFLSLDGDKGHHIWRSFMNYIDAHGGLELAGLPINEPIEEDNGNIRQCFQNLCLIEDYRLEGFYRIRPSPLGFEYASIYFSSEYKAQEPITIPSAQTAPQGSAMGSIEADQELTLEIIEVKPFVDQQTQQELGVIVRLGDQLAMNIRPTLYLSLPGGEVHQFEMPPTNEQGKSILVIPPIQAPNGTLVDYQICIVTSKGVEVCAQDDYLIWSP